MPRKRKYVDPAGSAPSQVLPPQSAQQLQPKQSRTRQPGDKWLKTMTTGGGTVPGFRYQSVYDGQAAAKAEEEGAGADANARSPSCGAPSPGEQERRARELGLSPKQQALWCWESGPAAVERGLVRGREQSTFRVIHVFDDEGVADAAAAGAAARAPARPQAVRPAGGAARAGGDGAEAARLQAEAEAGGAGLQWWWHGAMAMEGTGAVGAPPPSPPPSY